jgi:hypothetical protein
MSPSARAPPERADFVAGVHEVERVRLELACEEIVLDEADVPQALFGNEPVGGREHRLVDVESRHLSFGADPLAQDSEPTQHAVAGSALTGLRR